MPNNTLFHFKNCIALVSHGKLIKNYRYLNHAIYDNIKKSWRVKCDVCEAAHTNLSRNLKFSTDALCLTIFEKKIAFPSAKDMFFLCIAKCDQASNGNCDKIEAAIAVFYTVRQ